MWRSGPVARSHAPFLMGCERFALNQVQKGARAGRLQGRSHTAGSFPDSAPYVCDTTNPLACDV
jgi:hypothetical protein